jgi:ectoine hydroxylase-related dioxygenase (phytanoyl-CoA dioxygenase family)
VLTYAQHYDKCRQNASFKSSELSSYSSVYDLTLDTNFLNVDPNFNNLVKQVAQKVSHKIDNDDGCWHGSEFVTYLNEWRDINELNDLVNIFMPKLEQEVFYCNAQIEFVMPYRNSFHTGDPLASWLWHYDDCPREFIKFAVYLSDTYEDNGCFQYFVDPNEKPIVLPTFREAPNRPISKQYFAGSRVPPELIKNSIDQGCKIKSLVGPPGTHLLFTPNAIHRATSPKPNTKPREAIFFFIRPSLKKYDSYLNEAVNSVLPKRNVKQYELN